MILIDPLWDALEDEVDSNIYFWEEVWDERKMELTKIERNENNSLIIRYYDFFNLLPMFSYSYLTRNITKLLIEVIY